MGKKYRIFISYRRKDNDENKGIITRFHAQLERQYGKGKVFYDQVSNSVGAGNSNEQLCAAVRDSDYFIPIITCNYFEDVYPEDNNKGWCYMECMEALNNGVTVIPLIIDGFDAKLDKELFPPQSFNLKVDKVISKNIRTHLTLPELGNKIETDKFRSDIYKNITSNNWIFVNSISEIVNKEKLTDINLLVCKSFANKDNQNLFKEIINKINNSISNDRISSKSINDLFIEVGLKREYSLKEIEKLKKDEKTMTSLNVNLNAFISDINKNQYSVLVGEAGQGKSIMLKKIYIDLSAKSLKSNLNKDIVFPFYFECKKIIQHLKITETKSTVSLIDAMCAYIKTEYNIYFPVKEAIELLLEKGKSLFMFDAIDEVNSDCVDALCNKIEHEIPNACIVFSSRPNQKNICNSDFTINSKLVRKYCLDYFTKEQKNKYIDVLFKNEFSDKRESFKKKLHQQEKNVDGFEKIDSIPFILFNLVQNYNKRNVIPNTKIDIIDGSIDNLISRDRSKDCYKNIDLDNIKFIIGRVQFLDYIERDKGSSLDINIDIIMREYKEEFGTDLSVRNFLDSNLLFSHELLSNYYVGYYISNLLERNRKKIEEDNKTISSLNEIKQLAQSISESSWWNEITEATLCYLDKKEEDSKVIIEPLLEILQMNPNYDVLCQIVKKFQKHQPRTSICLIEKMLDRGAKWIICEYEKVKNKYTVNPYEELYYYVVEYDFLWKYLCDVNVNNNNETEHIIKKYLLINLENLIFNIKEDEVYLYENNEIIKKYECKEFAWRGHRNGYYLVNKHNVGDVFFSANAIQIEKNTIVDAYDDFYDLKIIKIKKNHELYDTNNHVNAIISKRDKELIFGCSTSKIPNYVKTIGRDAFAFTKSLEMVVLPTSLEIIEELAFANSSLRKIAIPENVRKIDSTSFNGCKYLSKIIVSKGNKIYDSRDDCNAIIETKTNKLIVGCSKTKISKNITSIEDSAFYGCTSLEKIYIPSSISEIGQYAFEECKFLTRIVVSKDNKVFDSRDNCNAIIETKTNKLILGCSKTKIPSNIEIIGANAFYSCKNLNSISIPNGLKKIETSAFAGCNSLKFIKLINEKSLQKNNITDISSATNEERINDIVNAFYWRSNLEETIPSDSFENMVYSVFKDCSFLKEMMIQDSIEGIGNSAFEDCSSLEEITLPFNTKIIGDSAFEDCSSLKKITLPNSTKIIGDSAFEGCSSLEEITIPNSAEIIGKYAFEGCSSLKVITLPDSIKIIGESTFEGCSSLKVITIPNSIENIEFYAFKDCSSLKEITFPDSIKIIDCYVFENCSSLKKITISKSINEIKEYAFSNCISLTDIFFEGSKEEWEKIIIRKGNDKLLKSKKHFKG